MTVSERRKDLLASGDELLREIDRVALESSELTTRARVDRLLESACPAIGVRYPTELQLAYEAGVYHGAPHDEVWDTLFRLQQGMYCGCADDVGCAEDECCDVDYLWSFFGYGSYSAVHPTPNNLDVLHDPELQPLHPPVLRDEYIDAVSFEWRRPEPDEVTQMWTVVGTVSSLDPPIDATVYVESAVLEGNSLRVLLGYDVADIDNG